MKTVNMELIEQIIKKQEKLVEELDFGVDFASSCCTELSVQKRESAKDAIIAVTLAFKLKKED